MSLRLQVYDRDNGRCIASGQQLRRGAGPWEWVAHHPVTQQTLRREGHADLCGDPRFAVLVARRPHEQHHNRIAPIPLERLPSEVVDAIDALGGWAQVRLRQAHPSAADRAGGTPAWTNRGGHPHG